MQSFVKISRFKNAKNWISYQLKAAQSTVHLQQKIANHLNNITLVSFDVFDTLVERKLDPPEDLKQASARSLVNQLRLHLGLEFTIQEILTARAEIESEIRGKNFASGQDYECHFSDLAIQLANRLCNTNSNAQLINLIQENELNIERNCLMIKPGMESICAWLKKQGLSLIAISDMYLSREQIESLLNNLGLLKFFARIYVSSEFLIAKYSGSLFKKILAAENIAPHMMLHIGDNNHSDVYMPRTLGIRAIWLNDKSNNQRRLILREYSKLADQNSYWRGRHLLQIISRVSTQGFAFDFGFNCLGPVFCTFVLGIIEQIRIQQIKIIFFLAREGELFQQIFNYLAPQILNNINYPICKYLYISRKVAAPAALVNGLTVELSWAPLYNPKQQGLLSLCQAFDLPTTEVAAIGERHGYKFNAKIKQDDRKSEKYQAFINDPALQQLAIQRGQAYQKLLGDYLAQHGFFSEARVALVDIGWNGATQRYLQDAFCARPDYPHVVGLYLGWIHGIKHEFNPQYNTILGLLYDVRSENIVENGVTRFEELFEESARAQHATTIGYQRMADGQVEPIFKQDHCADRQAELKMNPQIKNLQAGVLSFTEHFQQAIQLTGYNFADLRPFVMTIIERIVTQPRCAEARALMKITHSEDFGDDTVMDFAHDQMQLRDLLQPKKWLKKLHKSNWLYGSGRLSGLPAINFMLRYLDLHRHS